MKGIFVVGAGPAGMFAARQIALAGYEVFIFNRDIKPGGLVEYGIYPVKEKMKSGLRKQFAQVLAMPNVHYFGNVQVGDEHQLKIQDLQAMHPAAIVFACGAQGAKKLGLPGANAKGVYAAKDFVYAYNQLPPYASMDFSTGRRVAIVGVGNVAIDIARWVLQDEPGRVTESVVVIARRGPLEVKFDEKEIEYVEQHVSRDDLAAELERVRERCARCNQDVSAEKLFQEHFRKLAKLESAAVPPRLSFRFLSSPSAILPDASGRIARLQIAENDLVLKSDGSTSAVANGQQTELEVDTLIFAIGDEHDPKIGLPMGPHGYATQSDPDHPQEPGYPVVDPKTGAPIPGWFVAGWARKASTGLAGIARHDGEVGATRAIEYVKAVADPQTLVEKEILLRLEAFGLQPVTKDDLALLGRVEEAIAQERKLASFKFSDNAAMLQAIAEEQMRV